MQRSFSLLMLALLLVGCGSQPNSPQIPSDQPSVQPVDLSITPRPKGIFTNALTKRVLALPTAASTNGQDMPVPAVAPGATNGAMSSPAAEGLVSGDAARLMLPCCYGEFNQYAIQYAEESTFPGSEAATLLQAYQQTVKPLQDQWDAQARLVESRANIGQGDDSNVEYIYLPGENPDQPLKVRPDYFFRFASTPMKETLNVYVMKDQVLVHRMIWGEPHVALNTVKIDSHEAIAKARAALLDRSADPGYPVYPDNQADGNVNVVYDIPSDAAAQAYLNQNGESLRYFVNLSFEREVPTWVYEQPRSEMGQVEGPKAEEALQPKRVNQKQTLFASVEIDAITGAIRQMNRPTYYFELTPRPIMTPVPAVISNSTVSAPAM